MPNSIAQKLKIKPGATLLTLHAPESFGQDLQPLPLNVTITTKATAADQLHWFVKTQSQLQADLSKVIRLMKGDMICWIYYPKGTSKMQTDLTRDKGWDLLLAHEEFHWISLISFNEIWSVFGFRLKTPADVRKEDKPVEREIYNYVDPKTKEVRLPDDLEVALKRDKQASAFFGSLSFTNKKEYLEWIVTAKRPETRLQRVNGTIEKLKQGMKNPANR